MSDKQLFIVVYDDECDLCLPMAWDPNCEGALTCWSPKRKVAVFPSKSSARTSITISNRLALLHEAQGKIANQDFTIYRKHLKIAELSPEPPSQ